MCGQSLRFELDALEDRAVIPQRDFIFGPAVDELEYPLRHSAARDLAQIGDVVSPKGLVCHGVS
ncbi:MAG: hypothetical protein A3G24_11030 [Betaproteobacteria bacterium RIFCSPLOWO2_12_FULL_62_13]|nr:MAG: hypothetical protein A3G24_11030 [Betaproteobacteria bacterium RIFCSPLOWO2_12_FULL_62_13]